MRLLLVFCLISGFLFSQEDYKGQYAVTEGGPNKKIPVGKHEGFHNEAKKKNQFEHFVWYSDSGTVEKIKVKGRYKASLKLDAFGKMDWEEVETGIWMNKTKGPLVNYGYSPQQKVEMHYAGYLLNGKGFDSSFLRNDPLKGRAGGFIKGFTEGVNRMQPGDIRVVKISPEMGYGAKNLPGIPPNSTLVFIIFLVDVK